MIRIEARPESISLDLASAAVVVVDMQNDFGAEGGMFARAGIDVSAIRGVIAPIGKVLDAARHSGILVVYLKMGFQHDLSDAGLPDAPNWLKHRALNVGQAITAPGGRPSRILVRETWNTEIVEELAPDHDDVVLYKHRFSGFYETDLDVTLKRLGIRSLIFTGCTTSVCVESTLRDAMFRDYRCLLLEDCAAEPIGSQLQRTNHDASVLVVEMLFGWVTRSEELLSALAREPVSPAAPAAAP